MKSRSFFFHLIQWISNFTAVVLQWFMLCHILSFQMNSETNIKWKLDFFFFRIILLTSFCLPEHMWIALECLFIFLPFFFSSLEHFKTSLKEIISACFVFYSVCLHLPLFSLRVNQSVHFTYIRSKKKENRRKKQSILVFITTHKIVFFIAWYCHTQ